MKSLRIRARLELDMAVDEDVEVGIAIIAQAVDGQRAVIVEDILDDRVVE